MPPLHMEPQTKEKYVPVCYWWVVWAYCLTEPGADLLMPTWKTVKQKLTEDAGTTRSVRKCGFKCWFSRMYCGIRTLQRQHHWIYQKTILVSNGLLWVRRTR
jgi:hypothetical protein